MPNSDEESRGQLSPAEPSNNSETDLKKMADGIAHFLGGVPAYLHKNVAKALYQLYTLTLAYPTARINNAIAENNAASLERQKLTRLSGKQIAAKMQTDDQYAEAAGNKFAQKILRESINLNKISEIAMADLATETKSEQPSIDTNTSELSEDWLNVFQNEGSVLSSEDMQQLFGKILSGEIRKPGSYSIRTIRLMAQLDNNAAHLFVRLCSLSVSLRIPNSNVIIDARVVSMGNAAANSLAQFGFGFDQLNVLHEYGLIISDYNSFRDSSISVANNGQVNLPLTYQNQAYALIPKLSSYTPSPLHVHGVAFSQSGKELLRVVDIQPDQEYTQALTNFFDQQGFLLMKIASP